MRSGAGDAALLADGVWTGLTDREVAAYPRPRRKAVHGGPSPLSLREAELGRVKGSGGSR